MSSEPGFAGPESSADAAGLDGSTASAEDGRQTRKEMHLSSSIHRIEHMDELIRNLDILTYTEIAVLYYLDNSFLRFIFRSMVQFVYLMPKSPGFPEPPTQPYVSGIIGTNLICMLVHVIFAPPSPGEATRGYMHGGLLLDFVGQRGPTSRIYLLMLDFFILCLQLVMLTATMRRKKMGKKGRAPTGGTSFLSTITENMVNNQDHDAEEQGIIRPTPLDHPLMSDDPLDAPAPDHSQQDGNSQADPFSLSDTLYSGQAAVADLWIVDSMHEQYQAFQAHRAASTSPMSSVVRLDLRRRRYELNMPFRS